MPDVSGKWFEVPVVRRWVHERREDGRHHDFKLADDVPPPEPANAQGSEATPDHFCSNCEPCENCGNRKCKRECANRIETPASTAPAAPLPWADSLGSAMEDDMESMTPSEERAAKAAKPSAQRFTAEEARAFADTYDSRNEATLRHYADLLERDDALERAAEGALKLLHDVFDFTKRTPQVEATITNLSAVLTQRAGKVE